jgi:hypothetical protein
VVAFTNGKGYRVEFLTGNRGSDDYAGKPSPMPALGGASAEILRFLDYLIYEPVRTVLLHREGVSVIVPAPERFTLHKLIVASRRHPDGLGRAKSDKDLHQPSLLAQALVETRQGDILADAYLEAWERGKSWQDGIRAGLDAMPNPAGEPSPPHSAFRLKNWQQRSSQPRMDRVATEIDAAVAVSAHRWTAWRVQAYSNLYIVP